MGRRMRLSPSMRLMVAVHPGHGAVWQKIITAVRLGMSEIDVAGWLEKIGLSQYTELFREHEVDGDILPALTAQDLKEIGVVKVGHRRKLLNAVADLALVGARSAPD